MDFICILFTEDMLSFQTAKDSSVEKLFHKLNTWYLEKEGNLSFVFSRFFCVDTAPEHQVTIFELNHPPTP